MKPVIRSISTLIALTFALNGGAFAQGDDCSTAIPISGTGAFAFDTTSNTTSWLGGGLCSSFSINDTFRQWTAPASGDYVFEITSVTFDAKLSIWTGLGCAVTCANTNDSTLRRTQLDGLLAGDQILIQIGSFQSTQFGPGTLSILPYVDPCSGVLDDFLEDNDTCATAIPLAMGIYTGLSVSDSDSDHYSVTIPVGTSFHMGLNATLGVVDYQVFNSSCTPVFVGLGPLTYTNQTAAPETIIVEIYNYGFGGIACARYDLDFSLTGDPCVTTPDDSFEDNDDCANAAPVDNGTHTDLFASSSDKDFFSFCVAAGATVNVDALFLTNQIESDIDLALWDAADINCGSGQSSGTFLAEGSSANHNENIAWTNTSGVSVDVILEVHLFLLANACNSYDLVISGSGPGSAGTPFCAPANMNSTGASAVLAGSWSCGVDNDLHLEITGGVPGQFAFLIAGNEATAGIPISNGQFCLVGTPTAQFFRYNVAGTDMNSIGGFDASGTLVNASGTSTTGFGFDVPDTIPDTIPIMIMVGDTWQFQGWYRDTPAGVGSSNFTNGLSVTF